MKGAQCTYEKNIFHRKCIVVKLTMLINTSRNNIWNMFSQPEMASRSEWSPSNLGIKGVVTASVTLRSVFRRAQRKEEPPPPRGELDRVEGI